MTYLSKFTIYGALAGALAIAPAFAQNNPGDQPTSPPAQNASGTNGAYSNPVTGQRNKSGNLSNSNGNGVTGATNSPYTDGGIYNSGPNNGTGDHNFGWIGLIGLAGLGGLFRGTRRSEPDFSTRPESIPPNETKTPR